MVWNDDGFGAVFNANEIKLFFNGGHTWAMKLSQLSRQKGLVRIVTYSLPDLEYVKEQIGRRPHDIFIICHSKFEDKAREIKEFFNDVRIAVNDSVHSKVCLIEPDTVYIGSANFGHSGWHESIVGIRSREAHDAYVEKSFNKLWEISDEIGDLAMEFVHNSVVQALHKISIPAWALLTNSTSCVLENDTVIIGWPSDRLLNRFDNSRYRALIEDMYSLYIHKKITINNVLGPI